jgi:hypothetical protein
MHPISVRRDVLARAPSVGRALYEALCAAKCVAETECGATLASSSPATMFPFLAEEWAVMRALLGPDPWRYGVAANRTEFEALCRWSQVQHLARRLLQVEELCAVNETIPGPGARKRAAYLPPLRTGKLTASGRWARLPRRESGRGA